MKTNHQTGHEAEKRVAKHLKRLGYDIVELNWKTRSCEIDIVARKHDVMYFTEVKYRSHNTHGEGFDYITPKKLHQMTFAAEYWVQTHGWDGDYRLLAVSADPQHIEMEEI